MAYPNEDQIKKKLLPHKSLMWIGFICLLGAGFGLEYFSILNDGFRRFGQVSVVYVIFHYLILERKEFLTDHAAGLFDSNNHNFARSYVGSAFSWITIIGSVTGIFGDLFMANFICGAETC